MSRLGTCAFAHHVQDEEIIPFGPEDELCSRPGSAPTSDLYVCDFFNNEELPPPIQRHNGGFEIREGDCELCQYYQPAGGALLIRSLRKKRLKRKKRAAKVSS